MYRPLLVLAAYAVGTFPTARLLVPDITRRGSGNPGASNALRLEGPAKAALVLLGDATKGALATAAGLAVGGRALGLACGIAAVVGHCFPPAHRTRGGKGVATAAGMLAVLQPATAATTAVAWFAVARVTGKASVASLASAALVPIGTALMGRPWWEVTAVAGVAALIGMRHASNVRELVRGEERSLR